jgi:hypothetical protein
MREVYRSDKDNHSRTQQSYATISKELESVTYLAAVADTAISKHAMVVSVLRQYIVPQKRLQTEIVEFNK